MKLGIAVVLAAGIAAAQAPDLAHQREVFNKLCGTCHTPESSVTTRRTRAEWQEEIARMIANGAKGTEDEFAVTLDYLSSQFGRQGGGRAAGGLLGQMGPDDKHVVDPAAAERGRKIWAAECIQCHGTQARGTDNGANLVRSDLVLHDRYGDHIGPFLQKGHKMQSGSSSSTLTAAQVQDISHFIHERVFDTLRGSPIFHPGDVNTGNAKDGSAYFGARCAACHSPTGDLAHIAAKYDPPTLQGRFLNPRPLGSGGRGGRGGRGGGGGRASNAPQVTLTVTTPSGETVTGSPVFFDDFNVALRDSAGNYRSWKRVPGLKVVKNDPYAAHDELLTEYSDKNMHDVLAYLETLK
jgi:mono/diheme cytochrome c family protein